MPWLMRILTWVVMTSGKHVLASTTGWALAKGFEAIRKWATRKPKP